MAISKLPTGAILDNSITNAKIADDAIGVADLAATGTPSTTTFLRGDNAWATPIGGVTSVNGVTGAITAAHIATAVEAASGSNTFTDADHTKLSNIEGSATADQTNSEIKTAVEAATSIALGGSPTTTTQAESDNTTKLATTAYVTSKITTLIGGAPSTLNDLNELALAINDDANYNSTLTTALATKLPLAGGTMTGNLTVSRSFQSRSIDDTNNSSGTAITIYDSEEVKLHNMVGVHTAATAVPTYSALRLQSPVSAIGHLVGQTYVLNGTAGRPRAAIFAKAELANGYAASLAFMTRSAEDGSTLATTDERMTIKSNGNVGIGVTAPAGKMHIYEGDAGAVTPSAQADTLVVENSGEGGITIMTPDASSARIRFTSPSTESGDEGGADIFYRQNINKMKIGTIVSGGILALNSGANNETMTLDASGNVGIGVVPPSATSNSSYKQLFLNTGGAIMDSGGSGPNTQFSNNSYLGSGNNSYATVAQKASQIQLTSGDIRFSTAPSVSANAQQTFTTVMTVNDTGKVGIGIATPTQLLDVAGDILCESMQGGDYTTSAGTVSISCNQWGNMIQLSALEAGYLYYGDGYLPGYEHGTYHAQFFISSNTTNGAILYITQGPYYSIRVDGGWIQAKEAASGGSPSHYMKLRKLVKDT